MDKAIILGTAIGLVAFSLYFIQGPMGRRTDLKTLWPIFKEQAPDLETARKAFIKHMAIDPVWKDHFKTEEELGDWVRKNLV